MWADSWVTARTHASYPLPQSSYQAQGATVTFLQQHSTPTGNGSFGSYSGSLSHAWTKLAASNSCGSYESQEKTKSSWTQQPESWHPCHTGHLLSQVPLWSSLELKHELPQWKELKNIQPNTRHFFSNLFDIPAYTSLERRCSDPSRHLQLKGCISRTGRWTRCLGWFVESGCPSYLSQSLISPKLITTQPQWRGNKAHCPANHIIPETPKSCHFKERTGSQYMTLVNSNSRSFCLNVLDAGSTGDYPYSQKDSVNFWPYMWKIKGQMYMKTYLGY